MRKMRRMMRMGIRRKMRRGMKRTMNTVTMPSIQLLDILDSQ